VRALFGTVASGNVPVAASFGFDASSAASALATFRTSPVTWTHTPVGIPKGVVVFVGVETPGDFAMTSVTYGGVSMTQITGSPLSDTINAETHTAFGYFLGSGLPTGAQTISVSYTVSGSAWSVNAAAVTVSGPNNSAIEDTSTATDGGSPSADPTCALTVANDSVCAGILLSGQIATSSVAVGSGMTQITEVDVGNVVQSYLYKTALATTNTSLTWTVASEEWNILAIAIKST
jgi:hypothetical protein